MESVYWNLTEKKLPVKTVGPLPSNISDELHFVLHGGVANNTIRLAEMMDRVGATHVVVDYSVCDDTVRYIIDNLKIIRPGAVIDVNDIV